MQDSMDRFTEAKIQAGLSLVELAGAAASEMKGIAAKHMDALIRMADEYHAMRQALVVACGCDYEKAGLLFREEAARICKWKPGANAGANAEAAA